jgi:CO dehydrogenase nickel-insertion accessory protein CooC1
LKSLEIAKHIRDLAANAGMQQLYLVGNRIMNEKQKEAVTSFAEKNGLSILTFIPFDAKVIEADTLGETPLKNKEIAAVSAIDNICDVLLKKDI